MSNSLRASLAKRSLSIDSQHEERRHKMSVSSPPNQSIQQPVQEDESSGREEHQSTGDNDDQSPGDDGD